MIKIKLPAIFYTKEFILCSDADQKALINEYLIGAINAQEVFECINEVLESKVEHQSLEVNEEDE